jgi:regulation of enolase protein 1 (concanavalin A-like superfamily)
MSQHRLALSELTWLGPPGNASVADDHVTVHAGPESDWFNDPDAGTCLTTAPVLRFIVSEDCQVSAKVTVDFRTTFDAGVLFVHQGDEDYAKLCFERSPLGDNTMVSVVTRGVSDDANGPVIKGNVVWARVSGVPKCRRLSLVEHRTSLAHAQALRTPRTRRHHLHRVLNAITERSGVFGDVQQHRLQARRTDQYSRRFLKTEPDSRPSSIMVEHEDRRRLVI